MSGGLEDGEILEVDLYVEFEDDWSGPGGASQGKMS